MTFPDLLSMTVGTLLMPSKIERKHFEASNSNELVTCTDDTQMSLYAFSPVGGAIMWGTDGMP